MYTLNNKGLVSTNNGGVGVGTNAPQAGVHIVRDTEQLRLAYDTTNYATFTISSAGALTITPTGASIYTPKLRSGVVISNATADVTIPSTNTGCVYTNAGDTDGVNLTLPTAATGYKFTFIVDAAQTLTITASTGDTISVGESVTPAAGNISCNVVGSVITLIAISAVKWIATSVVGTWTVSV